MKYKDPNVYVSYRNHGLDVSSTILKCKYFVEL